MTLAHAAALRSEDPYRKVGAAALDADNRVSLYVCVDGNEVIINKHG